MYNPLFKLHSGNHIPIIGFGTFRITGDQTIFNVLDAALAAGYRLIDTAAVYNNEESIGKALKTLLPKHKLKREDICITSKLSPSDQGEKAFAALERSLKYLDCSYLDLFLIHWPGVHGIKVANEGNKKLRSLSWAGLVKAQKAGLVKDIGVSNYTVRHLKELLAEDCGVKPSVNQVEWHPKYYQLELLDFCKEQGIFLQAYSSLGGTGNRELLFEPVIKHISSELGKSTAQILLRWAVQQEIGIIPKASDKKRIQENIDLDFEIPEKMMTTLNELNSNTKFAWNPEPVL